MRRAFLKHAKHNTIPSLACKTKCITYCTCKSGGMTLKRSALCGKELSKLCTVVWMHDVLCRGCGKGKEWYKRFMTTTTEPRARKEEEEEE